MIDPGGGEEGGTADRDGGEIMGPAESRCDILSFGGRERGRATDTGAGGGGGTIS